MTSCAPENRVFEEHQKLSPDVEWLKNDIKIFKVKIADSSPTYDFSIAFRYANGYAWDVAKIIIKETSPSGKEKTTPYSLKIRDAQGNYLGESGYDIWDSTHPVEPSRKFEETGIYTYTISHDMPRDDFPWAMEVGLVIDRN